MMKFDLHDLFYHLWYKKYANIKGWKNITSGVFWISPSGNIHAVQYTFIQNVDSCIQKFFPSINHYCLEKTDTECNTKFGSYYNSFVLSIVSKKLCQSTPTLSHDQVLKKESSKPSMNIRPQVHTDIRNRWQNLWRLWKKWFFYDFIIIFKNWLMIKV